MDNQYVEQQRQLSILQADNGGKITDYLKTAITDNKTYLALTSPTTAQNTAEIKKLARQNVKVIRLLVNLLDEVK